MTSSNRPLTFRSLDGAIGGAPPVELTAETSQVGNLLAFRAKRRFQVLSGGRLGDTHHIGDMPQRRPLLEELAGLGRCGGPPIRERRQSRSDVAVGKFERLGDRSVASTRIFWPTPVFGQPASYRATGFIRDGGQVEFPLALPAAP